MKKILLSILIILILPTVLACDMGGGHGSEITGAAVYDTSMMGFGMIGFNYLGLILLLYFIIGLGYVIYKLNKIENKIKGGKR